MPNLLSHLALFVMKMVQTFDMWSFIKCYNFDKIFSTSQRLYMPPGLFVNKKTSKNMLFACIYTASLAVGWPIQPHLSR